MFEVDLQGGAFPHRPPPFPPPQVLRLRSRVFFFWRFLKPSCLRPRAKKNVPQQIFVFQVFFGSHVGRSKNFSQRSGLSLIFAFLSNSLLCPVNLGSVPSFFFEPRADLRKEERFDSPVFLLTVRRCALFFSSFGSCMKMRLRTLCSVCYGFNPPFFDFLGPLSAPLHDSLPSQGTYFSSPFWR